jgi:hypothetical protein
MKRKRLVSPTLSNYELIRRHNAFEEGFFGSRTLAALRAGIESTVCEAGGLIVIPALG